MNLNYFIFKRISKVNKNSFFYLVSKVAVASIAFGMLVMILAFAVLQGFQNKIREKIFSFGAHIEITKFDNRSSEEASPVSINTRLYQNYKELETVEHLQVFSLKPSLLHANDDVYGIIYKGIGEDFNLERFQENLIVEDKWIRFDTAGDFSRDIVISQKLADKMRLGIEDTATLIFYRDNRRPVFLKLNVRNIYATGLEEFDDKVILGDIALNQKLNNWGDTLVGGYEIFLKDFDKLDEGYQEVYDMMDSELYIQSVKTKYLQIFDWLILLEKNVWIFIIIILIVAFLNMVSNLVIMIMERTNMIGVMKTLGATNDLIQKIFILKGGNIILKGLLIGNIIGIGLALLQYYTHIIPLNQENYYMDFVPVMLDWKFFGLLNLIALAFSALVTVVPIVMISRIRPIKAIKFD